MQTATTEIAVCRGSLTDGDETVLVNASNTGVMLGSGVSAAIARACGPGYQERIREALTKKFGDSMEPGDVLITDAGSHPRARYVAHVAVMDYRPGRTGNAAPSLDTIRRGCVGLWSECETLPDARVLVAMVALGAGVGGLGVRGPTECACETLEAHLRAVRASRIARVAFYGYLPLEQLNIAQVVCAHFPDAVRTLDEELADAFRAAGGAGSHP
jgi:O-acetyl-ADP-ribose deacetylase (regulator of RNase III)